MTAIGAPLDRVDGPLKACGLARYTADIAVPGLAHAVMVRSTVPSGRIVRVDALAAERAPGVVAVLTHRNAMRLPHEGRDIVDPPHGRVLSLLQDDAVHYDGQPVAVVVAETLEQATAAAALVRFGYARTSAVLDMAAARAQAHSPGQVLPGHDADSRRGDLADGFARAAQRRAWCYATPMQHHNALEPHATLASWDGDRLTVHDATQYAAGVRKTLAKAFGIAPDQVRVRSAFVGGAFGGKGSAWSHVVLAAMAARQTGRPVRLVLQRAQLFGPVGGRPRTEQSIDVGAERDGTLTALEHAVVSGTSMIEDWTEASALVTRTLYACPNLATSHRLVRLNVGTPTFQRAPGEATGSFALECALDELAQELGVDPVELRLRNHAERDPESGRPFSSKSLRECYRIAAERFGWPRRDPRPRSMREGQWLVGWGMATATRPARRTAAQARVRLTADGHAVVQSSTADLGTGTGTVMSQIAADALGFAPFQVRVELGDTALPEAPIAAGSMTVQSVGTAVHAACLEARRQVVALAHDDPASPLAGVPIEDIAIEDGWLHRVSDPSCRDAVGALVARRGGRPLEVHADTRPGPEAREHAMHAYGAVFAEVRVDADLGIVRVPRVVGAYGVGRVINPKTAESQLVGGIVWGIGMALLEESLLDPRTGRIANADLAEYHVPVNADIGCIDVVTVDEHDAHVNPLGAKGIGEIGMTGVAAAIANAVAHATGVRVRELPIRVEKLIGEEVAGQGAATPASASGWSEGR